jgi:pilus assembly protein CpaE
MALNVFLSGEWRDLTDLRDDLASSDLAITAVAEDADVLVHAAASDKLGDELALVQEHTHAPIVLLVPDGASGLLEATLEADLAEVLVLPQPATSVIFAVRRAAAAAARRQVGTARGRVTTVFSPKGGTGKSVVACNLAIALAGRGLRTVLIDLDLQFGDVAIMLGVEPERTLHDLLTAPGSLDAEKIAGYAAHHRSGLDVLAAPLKPEDAESISEARVAELVDAARAGYDAVVVDTSPFFHGAVLSTLDRTDDLLMICTPDVPTLKNVRLTLQTLELLSFSKDRIRLVLNRANARVGFRAAQVGSVLEQAVEFELPEDELVAIAVNRGEAAVEYRPGSPFSEALTAAAARLATPGAEPAQQPTRRFTLGRRG